MERDETKVRLPDGITKDPLIFQVWCRQDESEYTSAVVFSDYGGTYAYTGKGTRRTRGQYTLRRVEQLGARRFVLFLDFQDEGEGGVALIGHEVISMELSDRGGVQGEGVWWTTDGACSGMGWVAR